MSIALSGPLFVTVIVHVIMSPNLGVELDTTLTTAKSASWPISKVALSSLLVKSGSGVSLVTLATLVITASVTKILVLIFKTVVSPFAILPIYQMLLV